MNVMLKEKVQQDIERLDESGLKEVADFMAFSQFRARQSPVPDEDDAQLPALYAEFAEEDRALAETGMAGYAAGLAQEDAAA